VAAAWLCITFVGCQPGVALVTAGGKVTLDGTPLADTIVEFQPTGGGGSPSFGTTNADGGYTLRYTMTKAGVAPGEHIVRIYKEIAGNEIQPIPSRYNALSELRATVNPRGRQSFDFEVSSK